MKPKFCFRCQHGYYFEHQCREAGLPVKTKQIAASPCENSFGKLGDLYTDLYNKACVISSHLYDLNEDVVQIKNFLGVGELASDSKTPKSTSLRGQMNQLDAKIEVVRKNTRPLLQKIRGKK